MKFMESILTQNRSKVQSRKNIHIFHISYHFLFIFKHAAVIRANLHSVQKFKKKRDMTEEKCAHCFLCAFSCS